ncbi:MAG: hypothetical protein LBD37_10180 [Treponema sp.]|jgi:hypothetical protein|nr:hypothetical protein [Treponema sp.]
MLFPKTRRRGPFYRVFPAGAGLCIRQRRVLLGLTVILEVSCGAVFPPRAQAFQFPYQTRWRCIAGAETGLFGVTHFQEIVPLWTGGAVRKLIKTAASWIILSDKGILASQDLLRWENRTLGLPIKTIKRFNNGKKSFQTIVQEIKDLEINPLNPELMVCATKEAVYLSRNGGRFWENLGMPAYRTNGIKAVGIANLPELTVLVSHSIYGVHHIQPNAPKPVWTALSTGLENLETTGNPDEVSDIAVWLGASSQGKPIIYAAQTFRRRIYRLDWEQKRFIPLPPKAGGAPALGTIDSLHVGEETIHFVQDGAIMEYNRPDTPVETLKVPLRLELFSPRPRTDIQDMAAALMRRGITPACIAWWNQGAGTEPEFISLSELWLLAQDRDNAAAGKRGLYFPVNHAQDPASLQSYLNVLADRRLDMVVIDMKDDYGRLRFTPLRRNIAEKGRVFQPLDIDALLKTMKSRGVYTAARIVVFKDPELALRENGKYAVWDGRINKPWAGYSSARRKKSAAPASKNPALQTQILPAGDSAYEIVRTFYDEQWVDPYSEEVWDYIAAIAQELHERGFDEIQFDYIRFPTDGENLEDAQYRWQDPGMDRESAILSFLQHIRARVNAPISIDIYGANGWYRTGARTGQEVELLAPYVDAICPMYYPSHFEQDFLAQEPVELRPYRIYRQGTERTRRIARGRIIVRPYVQAFFLNVSYDRKYYNLDYVRREILGVQDAGNGGYTYWNNAGRYDDIPKPRELTGPPL